MTTTWKSIGAVAGAIVAVFVLSLGLDEILHVAGVYPAWGVRMSDPLFGLATAYRLVFNVAAGYICAMLAPANPMKHVWILAWIGLALSALGVVGSLARPDLGPMWYPVILFVTAVPCTWLGGTIATRSVA
jgi:hypothetical protein